MLTVILKLVNVFYSSKVALFKLYNSLSYIYFVSTLKILFFLNRWDHKNVNSLNVNENIGFVNIGANAYVNQQIVLQLIYGKG